MEMLKPVAQDAWTSENFAALCNNVWQGRAAAALDRHGRICRLNCWSDQLVDVCQWLSRDLDFAFATLIVEELPDNGWSLLYIFYKGPNSRGFTSNPNSMRLRPQCRPSAALFMDLLQTGMNAKRKTCLA